MNNPLGIELFKVASDSAILRCQSWPPEGLLWKWFKIPAAEGCVNESPIAPAFSLGHNTGRPITRQTTAIDTVNFLAAEEISRPQPFDFDPSNWGGVDEIDFEMKKVSFSFSAFQLSARRIEAIGDAARVAVNNFWSH